MKGRDLSYARASGGRPYERNPLKAARITRGCNGFDGGVEAQIAGGGADS